MTTLMRRNRPSMLGMRRDVEDLVDEFDMPRSFRNEIVRLFGEDLAPRTMWAEMDRLMDDFTSPPSLRRRISSLFNDFTGGGRGLLRGREMYVPAVDVTERDNEYLMRVDLPGMREQDIDVRVDANNILTVSGERREEQTRNERGYQYTERTCGSFSRSIELPRGVDAAKIETDFRNGVLDIRVPKGEAAQSRRIPIGSGRETSKAEEPRIAASGNGGGARGEAPNIRVPEAQANSR